MAREGGSEGWEGSDSKSGEVERATSLVRIPSTPTMSRYENDEDDPFGDVIQSKVASYLGSLFQFFRVQLEGG